MCKTLLVIVYLVVLQRFVIGRLILGFLLNLRLKESRNQCQFSWVIELEIIQMKSKNILQKKHGK